MSLNVRPLCSLLLATLVLTVLPMATAQTEGASFRVEGSVPMVLDPSASTPIPVNVTVSCVEILEKGGEAEVDVALESGLAGVVANNTTIRFSLPDCAGNVAVTKGATLEALAQGAYGLEPFTVTVSAALGSHTARVGFEERMVAYRPGHLFDPAGDQTFQVDGDTYRFDLGITITANADTMVMFEDRFIPGTGTITGLRAMTFDVDAGETTATNRITFTPGGPNWTAETVTFRTYSHCLGGPDCPEEGEETVTWTFLNAAPSEGVDPAMDGPQTAESPAVAPFVFGFVAILLAAGARHRRTSTASSAPPTQTIFVK